jgi:hypothetical protein
MGKVLQLISQELIATIFVLTAVWTLQTEQGLTLSGGKV